MRIERLWVCGPLGYLDFDPPSLLYKTTIAPLLPPLSETAAAKTFGMGDAEVPKEEEAKPVRAAAPRAQPLAPAPARPDGSSGHSPEWRRPKPMPAATLLACPCLC